ncbi:iron ABC transporter permease [Cytobacillus oceanisediminis]|uniref:Iron ABC transporter permease n=1 Tax=Niallia alba TaxID=2729105 RepID=A0A7Y0K7F8_9BACI|nr:MULTISPECIES: iron ABC transporter permease [Bacillaceae]EOR25245.1 iron compound ABC transporter permease [Niallia nealsonii AAU1]MDU1847188.1 iron ABC transporter permease [Niallia nealsonii]MBZ9535281.1 iron ABC transporter permease [Cytobacillus oceanisediminis]NMO76584.1 iron ABC transporter permease [Niallia alba]UTI44309.1 iron ABC transporter permease [Niallia sp. RD1]
MKKYTSFRVAKNHISFLFDSKSLFLISTFFIFLLVIFFISAGIGEEFIPPWEIVTILLGHGSDFDTLIVQSFRMPRILLSILVGMSLAVAGAILQSVVRNPLASPDIIGITGGASVAVVLFLALFSDMNHSLTISISWMPLAAFIGATLVAFLLYLLAWKKGVSPVRLVLVGIGLWALTKSLTTLFMILGPIYQVSQANIWITGSVYAANWGNIQIAAPIILILLMISFIMIRTVNIQDLGEEIAIGLGSKVQQQRFVLLLICTALIGTAVAFAGGIGFVGLMAPHIARKLVGSSFGALLPLSAFIGAILVLIADTIGRTLFLPIEVPAGIFTATIGAPYFIFLLYKQRNA